jgi:type I restriction enzyme S subunit
MIADLKPYAEYKESGLTWFERVPGHWEIKRLKDWVSINKQTLSENAPADFAFDYLDIGAVTTGRIIKTPQYLTFAKSPSRARRLLQPGDTVVSTVRTYLKAVVTVGSLTRPLVASTGFAVLSPRPGTLPRCLGYIAQSQAFIEQLTAESLGIAYPAISETRLGNIALLLPPLAEQAAIVRFLDWANGRLERAIRAKRKVIALLNEQKQAIIHRAVTRGLDPSVPLKPSGIPWLGDIPAHWEVRRLRHLIVGRLAYGANAAAEFTNCDWPRYIRITDFSSDGTLKRETFRSLPPAVAVDYLVAAGDILFARSGATVGKAFLVHALTGSACHAGYLIRARPNQTLVCPEFLFAFTQTRAFAAWKDSTFNTATIQNIGADKYANLGVPLPTLAEQMAILGCLTRAQAPILSAISRLEREINLLREYRTRLVADVVTGKLDVREAAARLPHEEPLPDAADVGDTDRDDDLDPDEEPDA